MSEQETVQVDHQESLDQGARPAGLLRFYPLGTPPAMAFFALPPKISAIGRSEQCAIQIEDHEASRKHALVDGSGGEWNVGDCQSANGTFVNGRRVDITPLSDGDVIRIGTTFFRFFARGTAEHSCEHAIDDDDPMICGPSLAPIKELLARAASSDLAVLISGETGTGKELAARRLHDAGARREGPFVAFNCGAIPDELVESELFGHKRGAFTNADSDREGLVRQADRGTLFIDELGELALVTQVKLLRVLQEKRVRPVGGDRELPVDFRVVCATNRPLRDAVESGIFRADLFARVAELEIRLPPLRERIEDVPLLAQTFIAKHAGRSLRLSVGAIETLCQRRWPFNVRELESAIRRALLLAGEAATLEARHFVEEAGDPQATQPDQANRLSATAGEGVDQHQERLIEALQRHEGDVGRAAKELGISASQLYRRAQKYNIRIARFRR